MRILIVQETNWIERNVIHQHHLAERLVKRGHEVEVIDYDILWRERGRRRVWQSRQIFPEVNRVIEGVAIPVTRPLTLGLPLLCHLSWSVSSFLELRNAVRGRRPDVVVGLTLTNSAWIGYALKKAGIPYILVVLEPYHTMVPERWARPFAKINEKKAMQLAKQVVVFTGQMQLYSRNMGVPEGKTALLKTGIHLEPYSAVVNPSTRAGFGLSERDWVLFFMGWLYDFSGLREIVSAVARQPDLLDGVKILIVGDGDLYRELDVQLRQANLSDRVILAGHRPYAEIPGLLSIADVCLLPSLENNTTRDIVPMKIYEYLAAGKPVVASRLPGLVGEFGEGNGLLYAGTPQEALAKAVGLRQTPERVVEVGRSGRRFVEQNADWEKTTDDFERLLMSSTERVKERVAWRVPS